MAAASVATSSAAPPTPASPASTPISRVTKGGRTLWYRLTVLQEPERARACGNGLKSTTDRRPVDPPPVVELRIYEGENLENVKDITFTYNANFFLFARLEHARPMANGRVNTPAANTPPVLTGMFVSGMAYLDRPSEAGYFLFPDLSVRHEGRYKLVFDLFENTKEDKDRSPDADEDESYDHRLRIESRAFNVYSAKKFPGLTQSTDLSRVISDQGCRVRIRRDVRMRRRETKRPGASDYESQVKDEFEHGQRTLTPETNHRARSASNASIDRTPHQDAYRRPSNAEYPPPPPSYGAAPSTPGSAGGHAHFGQPPASPYPSTPTQQQYAPHHHPTSIAPQPPYQPPAQPATHSYSHHRAPNQLQYPPLQAAPPRQPSAPASHQYASERPLSRMNQQFHTLPQPSNSSSRRSSEILAPIKPLERDDVPRLTPIRAAPINSAPEENVLPPARDIVRGLPPPSSCKRPFGETFAVEGYNQKLSNRGRQQDPHMYPPSRVWTGYDEPYASRDPKYLSYSRANGEKQTKPMPAVSYS